MTPVNEEADAYQTYVLRLWRGRCKGRWQWRASIEAARTCERQAFAGLDQLFTFLRDRCGDQTSEPATPPRAALGSEEDAS